jgi:hypothetical protein
MKIAAGIARLTSEDDNSKNTNDIMKKDMTTDHEGKAIAVRQLKGDKLPSTMPSTTKSTVDQKTGVKPSEDFKRLQTLKAEVGKQIDRLRREFIDDGMGFKTLQKQG